MMNILPIIFALLLILGISSSSFLEQRKDSKRFTASYEKSHSMHRDFLVKTTDATEKLIKKAEKEAATEKKPSTNKEKIPYKRDHPKASETRRCAKLNLFPLLSAEKPEEELRYKLFLNIVEKYYKDASYLKNVDVPKTTKNLLDSIIKSAKIVHEKKEPIYFEKLALENPLLQKLFYKLLKGSGKFSQEKKRTFPSILDFISIDAAEYQKMCFEHLSREMLSILFDDDISDSIFEAYMTNRRITNKLLNEILANNHMELAPEIKQLFNFTHVQSNKLDPITIFGEDNTKQMQGIVKRYIEVVP